MKIYNPTENTLTVTINGQEYTVGPKDEIVVSKAVALYWKNSLHNFLEIIEADDTAIVAPTLVEPTIEDEEASEVTE